MKTIIKEFDPVIYPRKVWVCIGDFKEAALKFEYSDGKPLEEKEKGFYGVTFNNVVTKGHDKLGVLIHFRHVEKPSQAMHEAIHAANAIFDDLGITFTLYADEHYAYFVEWICDCILRTSAMAEQPLIFIDNKDELIKELSDYKKEA